MINDLTENSYLLIEAMLKFITFGIVVPLPQPGIGLSKEFDGMPSGALFGKCEKGWGGDEYYFVRTASLGQILKL